MTSAVSCFNPPPALRPGETRSRPSATVRDLQFQSAPGGEAGGNAATSVTASRVTMVSIRPRR